MSRTHFITKPVAQSITAETNAMQTALSTLELQNNDLDDTPETDLKPEHKNTRITIALSELLTEGSRDVRSMLCGSFISSLNLSIVTRLRNYLAAGMKPVNIVKDEFSADDEQTLDMRNDEDDAAGANSGCYGGERIPNQGAGVAADTNWNKTHLRGSINVNEANAEYSGNRVLMNDFEIAKRLCVIRSFIHLQQKSLRQSVVPNFLSGIVTNIDRSKTNAEINFVPRSLNESVEFLKSMTPQVVNPDDELIDLAVAACLGLKTREQITADKNIELKRIRDLYPDVVVLGDALTANYEPDAQEVERAFDQLPAIARINLMITAGNACTSVFNRTYKAVLTRGKVESAGDMFIAKALHALVMTTLTQMCTKDSVAVNELFDRGGQLKEMKQLA